MIIDRGKRTLTSPQTLLVFDETVTPAGVEGWIRHLETAGELTDMYQLGGTPVFSVSAAELVGRVRPNLLAPAPQVLVTPQRFSDLMSRLAPMVAGLGRHMSSGG